MSHSITPTGKGPEMEDAGCRPAGHCRAAKRGGDANGARATKCASLRVIERTLHELVDFYAHREYIPVFASFFTFLSGARSIYIRPDSPIAVVSLESHTLFP